MVDARKLCIASTALAIAQWFFTATVITAIGACSALLPRSEALTVGPWQSFEEAQRTFDQIIPHKTTVADLKRLKLEPESWFRALR